LVGPEEKSALDGLRAGNIANLNSKMWLPIGG